MVHRLLTGAGRASPDVVALLEAPLDDVPVVPF